MRHPYRPAIGVATVPLDRFIFLTPWKSNAPGWIITKPFVFEGTRLEVNADAQEGNLTVEVLDELANPWDGFSAAEQLKLEHRDSLRWEPRWQRPADLSRLRGKTIRLKFALERARLYAFQVKAE